MRGNRVLPSPLRLRLRWKIVLLVLALHGALGTAFSLILTHIYSTALQAELEHRGAILARHLAQSVVDPFLLNDLLTMQKLADQTLALEDDLVYVFIAATGQVPLVHTFEGGFPKALLTAHQPRPQEDGVSILQLDTERGMIIDLAAPVLAGQEYHVHLGLANVHVVQALAAAQRLLYIVMAVFGVVGFALALVLAAFITRPLALLAKGVEEIGRGELGKKVTVAREDELGTLAMKFNEMSDNLSALMAERLQAEQEQRETLALMESIANGIGEGILILDLDWRIVWANTHILAQYALDENDIRGKTCYEVFHGLTAPCFVNQEPCPVLLNQEPGNPVTLEHVHVDGGGSQKTVEVVVCPRRDEQGKIYQYLHISRDISERLEKGRLEEQLRHSQKMEAIGRLSGGMAHDFNNILSAIIGFSELGMLGLPAGDPLREKFASILAAGMRGAELTRQLLAFSRKELVVPRIVNLNTVIANFSKMLYRLVGEDVKLELYCRPDIGKIKADAGQIEQVLMNLAVNAREAMPKGGKLTIATKMQRPAHQAAQAGGAAGNFVMLSVADTGHGFDAGDRERIFEPFFTTKAQGTGLGLATVYGIVQQHGGVLEVNSIPGQGTTFFLYFPEVQGEEERIASAPKLEYADMARGTETILVVDDSPELVSLLVEILSPLGYEVIGVLSAQEAAQVSGKMAGAIDLLLTDVVMPEMNGVELAGLLRRDRPGMKVIYMSGYADNYLGIADREAGSYFLEKPIPPVTLARKVREVLDAEGTAAA